jgi:radical SAM superfamily enzyme YgiQ (UPF0313 family)
MVSQWCIKRAWYVDSEFLDLAKKAGCMQWFVGFESVNQSSLNSINKRQNKVQNYPKIVKLRNEKGMSIQAGIIFGFDNDLADIFDYTFEKLCEFEFDAVEINILTPYPGTNFFYRLNSEGRILTKDWSKYNQIDVVFKPKNMTERELYEGTRYVAKNFYNN